MGRSRLAWVFALLVGCPSVLLSGCEEESAPIISGSGDNTDRDSGYNGDGDGDGDGGTDAGGDPRAPVVEIVSPDPMTDPNDDEVLTGNQVTVRCRVKRSPITGAAEIDPSTVSIGREVAAEEEDDAPTIEAGTVTALGDDEYEATLSLTSVDTGPLVVVCQASDVREMPLTTVARRSLLVDRGPKVTIVKPAADSTHRSGSVAIEVAVEAWPINDDDTEAEVDAVTLDVLGRAVSLTEDPEKAGRFTGSINFADTTLFPMPPSTARVTATATNSRTPTAVTRTRTIDIIIDAVAPTISVDKPTDGSIVRGQVTLELTILDASMIDASSIVATVNPGSYKITEWTSPSRGKYSGRFDTTDTMFRNVALLTINFEAADTAGNVGQASFNLRLDNVPPLISLDPPLIREVRRSGNINTCSAPFDPLGEAMSDLDVSPESSLYRAFVFDDTNRTVGDVASYLAGVNRNSVQIFAQPDPSVPLLIDINGDGICDEIKRDGATAPVSLNLSPLSPAGASWYPKEDHESFVPFDDPSHTPHPSYQCNSGTNSMTNPRCGTTSMTRFTSAPGIAGDSVPAVYAFGPDGVACGGNAWSNLLSIVGEGWACIAGRAEDSIGNVGVSEPIRICFDDGNGPPACNPAQPETAPTCTASCTSIAVPPHIVVDIN